jgi:hypothetical protein
MGSRPGLVKPKAIKLVFVASPLNTQHYAVRAKTGNWLKIKTMSPSDATCLPADCCFSGIPF